MIVQADARAIPLRDGCVQCVVTSPPYYGLRDYGTARWEGGAAGCDHRKVTDAQVVVALRTSTLGPNRDGVSGQRTNSHQQEGYKHYCCRCGARRIDSQIGLEASPDAYVAELVAVFREVRRVLRPDGVCFLVIGDSYASNAATAQNPAKSPGSFESYRGSSTPTLNTDKQGRIAYRGNGIKGKDLIGIPWSVAFALRNDGWWLRSDIIWSKQNPMPESVTDRPTRSHEYVFLLTKRERYFWDAEAVREPVKETSGINMRAPKSGPQRMTDSYSIVTTKTYAIQKGANLRSVWTIATQPYSGAHFATFPEALVERCVLAATPARCCGQCGAPYQRLTERDKHPYRDVEAQRASAQMRTGRTDGHVPGPSGMVDTVRTVGYGPACSCHAEPSRPLVLDPFCGSGTVQRVAYRLGRRGVGCDLNPAYLQLAEARTQVTLGLPLELTPSNGDDADEEQTALPLEFEP